MSIVPVTDVTGTRKAVKKKLLSRLRRCRKPLAIVLFVIAVLVTLDRCFPPPVPGENTSGVTLVVARDGTPLRAFPNQEYVWRYPIALTDVSPLYLEALVNYEDRWFYHHFGINPVSMTRAAWQWLQNGKIVSGGSTITMQVARILEPPEKPGQRNLLQKLRQMVRALQLEIRYSKEEILTLYINHAPMGGVLEGVEAASRSYLGKPANRLSHAEAAMLAVLPQGPSVYRPDRHPARMRKERDKVIKRMQGIWSDEDIADALGEPPYAQTVKDPLLAPLLAERLRRKSKGQARVQTTIDAQAQQTVEFLLLDRIHLLPPHVSLAVLVVDNATLEVRAYAGSADFSDAERFSHVDMVQAQRSPGSTLKPFLYGFALEEGLIHSESLLADAPQSFSGYQPGNFHETFNGPVSVSEALSRSLNVPAVEVLEQLEPAHFVALLRRGGLKMTFPAGVEPNLSVILGGAGTSLEQLVGAYTAFARQGLAGKPRLTPDEPLEEQRMLSPGAAFIIRDILETGGPMGRALGKNAGLRRGIAWKTGTSFGFRDAWAIGVSDTYTVGVWVGRPDGTPNPGFFGANVAAPLLLAVFNALPSPVDPSFTAQMPPPDVQQERICWPLGLREADTPPQHCHRTRLAWTLDGTAPPTFPDRLRSGEPRYTIFVDAQGRRALPDCAKSSLQRREMARWPAILEPWLDKETRRKALPPAWLASCTGHATPEAGVKIVGAKNGEIIRRTVTGEVPLLRLDIRGKSDGDIFWLVNGRNMGTLPAYRRFELSLSEPGRYDVTAMDETGHYDRITLTVR